MIIDYRKGNLLDHDGPIAHGVNCQGKMNSGVAKAIREKYPQHYRDYMHEVSTGGVPPLLLGNVFCTDQKVWGLFTQLVYGYNGVRYVNYWAVANCFRKLNRHLIKPLYPPILGIPKIGAGLGGGDWNIIEQIINDATPNLDIIVYEL